MDKASIETLFQSLLSGLTNPRARQSLERIKEACDFLESSKATITPTSVARYCESRWGGPKAQSIRNASDTLFAYIQARRGGQALPVADRKKDYEPPIRDEAVRAYVALVKAERDEAVRMKSRIIQGLKSIPGIPIDELLANGFKAAPTPQALAPATVPPAAIDALRRLLNESNLLSVGLEVYKSRLRHSQTKKVLLEKADLEAIQSLIGSSARADPSPQGDCMKKAVLNVV
jgi:hypothetical protein